MTAEESNQPLIKTGSTEIAGHTLYWEHHGAPEMGTLTLLHHGLGSVRSWRRQLPALIRAGWEVFAYDRWGYGRSDPRLEFTDRFLMQDALEAIHLLDLLGIDRTALMGHSDGGSIALLMAAMQPTRFTHLVVIAAHVYYEEKMRAGLLSIAGEANRPPLSIALMREHGDRAEKLTDMWIKHWLECNPDSLDISDRLAQISCPTLVIQGELDEHATPQHARDIATSVKHGVLWLVPEVGHMPPHEIPGEFNRQVLDFLGNQRL